MNQRKLEIACFNLRSALIAQQGGADRIELCEGFSAGGTTPGYGMFETAGKLISAELFVMIRPRGGDFSYSDEEFGQMKKDIVHFQKMNADGFVFGILNKDGNLDSSGNKELIELAAGLPCTLHRAFDQTPDALKAMEAAISCGFKTILTSGHAKTADEGIVELKELVQAASGRIMIMPGGGVRSSNIEMISQKVITGYYHSSAIINNEEAAIEEVRSLKKLLSK